MMKNDGNIAQRLFIFDFGCALIKESESYDEDGNLVEKIAEGSGFHYRKYENYEYDENGNKIREEYDTNADGMADAIKESGENGIF